jgi:hypothetical protein
VPRYFFHIQDGKDIPDKEGTVLADPKAARIEAIATGGAILRETANYWDGAEWRMNVTDEAGTSLFRLRFSAEVDPEAA